MRLFAVAALLLASLHVATTHVPRTALRLHGLAFQQAPLPPRSAAVRSAAPQQRGPLSQRPHIALRYSPLRSASKDWPNGEEPLTMPTDLEPRDVIQCNNGEVRPVTRAPIAVAPSVLPALFAAARRSTPRRARERARAQPAVDAMAVRPGRPPQRPHEAAACRLPPGYDALPVDIARAGAHGPPRPRRSSSSVPPSDSATISRCQPHPPPPPPRAASAERLARRAARRRCCAATPSTPTGSW